MKLTLVPQEHNRTLQGQRKALYACDADGKIVITASSGWEVEEIVTLQAVHSLQQQVAAAYQRCLQGVSSPLEYWMYAKRMDIALLAQSSGFWQWRIRRHLRPSHFARLSPRVLERHAQALGISLDALSQLPASAPITLP